MVTERINNIINNQLDAVNSTYPELLEDLAKEGLIREE